MIPRLQLVELEDLPWVPAVIRDLATDYLRFIGERIGLHTAVTPILKKALEATNSVEVIDLCSGSGGPAVPLQHELAVAGMAISIILTDRFPNLPAFRAASRASASRGVRFVEDPVDARAVPPSLPGFRTLFNAFHHFAPEDARVVLRDAVDARAPIAVFELPERSGAVIIPFFFLMPVMILLVTPFMRPFRWRRLLFTYLVPLVPLMCWWDGLVSHFRVYTVPELERLANEVGGEGYEWRVGRIPLTRGPGRITYLMGLPCGAT